jgi:hypothetical protein
VRQVRPQKISRQLVFFRGRDERALPQLIENARVKKAYLPQAHHADVQFFHDLIIDPSELYPAPCSFSTCVLPTFLCLFQHRLHKKRPILTPSLSDDSFG